MWQKLLRATLISTSVATDAAIVAACVNALARATLISTIASCFYHAYRIYVSMPSHGQHSFLRDADWDEENE